MSYKEQYDFWLKDSYFDEKTNAFIVSSDLSH